MGFTVAGHGSVFTICRLTYPKAQQGLKGLRPLRGPLNGCIILRLKLAQRPCIGLGAQKPYDISP